MLTEFLHFLGFVGFVGLLVVVFVLINRIPVKGSERDDHDGKNRNLGNRFNNDWISQPDTETNGTEWWNDPAYSHLPGNLWYSGDNTDAYDYIKSPFHDSDNIFDDSNSSTFNNSTSPFDD